MNKSPYDIGCSGYYFHDFFFFFFFRFFSWIATYEVYICFKFLWIFRIKRLMKNLNYLCLLVMDSGTLYLTRLISLHLSLSLSLSHTHTPACAPPYSPSSHSSQLIRRKELCQFYGWYIELIYGLNISLKGWGYMYH